MLTFALAALLTLGQPSPAGPTINLPVAVVPWQPTPTVKAVVELTPDLLYVADSKTEWLIITSPEGLLSVTAETGPLRVRGKFLDAPTKTQTKTFAGPFVYSIEAIGTGNVEVLFVPVGAKDASAVKRQMIAASIGPPTPKPPPVDPVVPPADLTAFGKQIKGWAEAVDRPTRKAEAAALAKSFRAGQSAAKAGAFPDLAAMSAALLTSNRSALGDARAEWTPAFFVPLAAALNATVKTVPQYADLCGEIADGLTEAVK